MRRPEFSHVQTPAMRQYNLYKQQGASVDLGEKELDLDGSILITPSRMVNPTGESPDAPSAEYRSASSCSATVSVHSSQTSLEDVPLNTPEGRFKSLKDEARNVLSTYQRFLEQRQAEGYAYKFVKMVTFSDTDPQRPAQFKSVLSAINLAQSCEQLRENMDNKLLCYNLSEASKLRLAILNVIKLCDTYLSEEALQACNHSKGFALS